MGEHFKWRQVVCKQCGKQFASSSKFAAYCSSTCRTRARRAAQGKDKAIARAFAAIDELTHYCVQPSAAQTIKDVITWMCQDGLQGDIRIIMDNPSVSKS